MVLEDRWVPIERVRLERKRMIVGTAVGWEGDGFDIKAFPDAHGPLEAFVRTRSGGPVGVL